MKKLKKIILIDVNWDNENTIFSLRVLGIECVGKKWGFDGDLFSLEIYEGLFCISLFYLDFHITFPLFKR